MTVPIPKAERVAVTYEQDAEVTRFMQEEIRQRVEKLSGKNEKGGDNILKIMNDIRLKSLEDGRISACAQKVLDEYNNSNDRKGAQLIFCDLSTPKDTDVDTEKSAKQKEKEKQEEEAEKRATLSVYKRVKDQLVEMGIPADEIKFIHEAKNDKEKLALFQEVRSGNVRVLLGSTTKMGAGTNMQDKLVSLHHLQVPWRPRDLEQREGRILRQGNENKEVRIYTYGAPGSFDAVMWSKVLAKEKNIGPMMDGDMTSRSIDYQSEVTPSHTEMIAMCSGDQSQIVLANAQNRVDNLRIQKQAWERSRRQADKDVLELPDQIANLKQGIENAKKDMKERKGDAKTFRITIDGKTYTNRGEAKAAFEKAVNKAKSDFAKDSRNGEHSQPAYIGEVAGFTVRVVPSGDVVAANLYGYNVYTAKTPSAEGVFNAAFRDPEARIQSLESMVKATELKLEEAKKAAKAPFEQAAELREAEETLAAVEAKIREDAANRNQRQVEAPAEEGTTKYSITNRELTADTPFKVVDITNKVPFTHTKQAINALAEKLAGKVFQIQGISGTATFTKSSAKHALHGSQKNISKDEVQNKVISDDETISEIIDNAIYVERGRRDGHTNKRGEIKHGGAYYVDFYAAVRDGDKIYSVRVVAEDLGSRKKGAFQVKDVKIYELYKKKEVPLRRVIQTGSPGTAEPLSYVTLSQLLGNVNGRDGKPFINEDGTPNFAPDLVMFSISDGAGVYRTDDEMAEMVRQSHPNAQNWERTEHGVTFETPDGRRWEYQFEDEIILTEEQLTQANEDYGGTLTGNERVQGRATTTADRKALITLTRDSEEGTADHEAFHVAMAGALTETEQAKLRAYAEKERPGLSLNEQEEFLADDYKEWQNKRRNRQGSLMGRLYQKIEDFAYKVLDMFGFRSLDSERRSIYQQLSSGEIFTNRGLNVADQKIIDKNSIRSASAKYLEKTAARLRGEVKTPANVHVRKAKGATADMELWKMLTTGSPSRSTNSGVRVLWRWARSAMDTQTRLERNWTKQHADILRKLKTDEDVAALNALNWEGDAKQHEFTQAELKDRGVSANVAEAYSDLRGLMKDIYTNLNDVKTMVHPETKNNVTEAQLAEMKKVKFFNILSQKKNDDGTYNVTLNTPEYRRFTKTFTKEELADLKKQKDRVTILNVRNGQDGKVNATVYMQAKPVANRAGYIPHIFHEQMIARRMLDKEASATVQTATGLTEKKVNALKGMEDITVRKVTKRGNVYDVDYTQDIYKVETVGSAETLSEAVDKASRMSSENGEEYFITPKTLLSDMHTNGVLVGDQEYDRMVQNLMGQYSISLPEAQEMLRGVVKTSNKHRFNSSFMHRKGAQGFEEDSRWVIQQHIRNSARYIAMEPFKYKALNLFERTYGAFGDAYDAISWAGWSKGYLMRHSVTRRCVSRASRIW